MENGKWVTINGTHVLIKDGENPMNAFIRQKGKEPKEYVDDYEYGINEDDEDAYDKYVEMSEESYQNLDNKDIYKIQDDYTKQENSWEFNEALRNDEEVDLELKGALDRACQSYTSKEKMASTRFVNMDYLRNAYGLEIQRYGDVDRSKVAEQMKEFIDSEISSKSYTSVSLNESGNGMFNNLAVKMKINMPKGTKMYVADNVGEYEAILGRNTKMILKKVDFKPSKIQGFENEYGKVLLTYEVINDDKN